MAVFSCSSLLNLVESLINNRRRIHAPMNALRKSKFSRSLTIYWTFFLLFLFRKFVSSNLYLLCFSSAHKHQYLLSSILLIQPFDYAVKGLILHMSAPLKGRRSFLTTRTPNIEDQYCFSFSSLQILRFEQTIAKFYLFPLRKCYQKYVW